MRKVTNLDEIDLANAKPHPILTKPWTYFVSEIDANFDKHSQQNSSLKLKFVRDGEAVSLAFGGLQELEIDAGFPYFNSGLHILDISHLGWDSLHIRVQGFEQDPGIRFWANSVERVD